jgi:hypothetical protein
MLMHLIPGTLIRYYLINVKTKVVTSINQYAMKNYRRTYIYICIYVCVCVYIYIYIERERERETDRVVRLPKCGISVDLNG